MDPKTLGRLLDYLAALRKRDLDLAIVMDSTASMLPMINEARAGVDSLILFLSDISGSMRLAFVAYRDHDNKPVWEGHRFTDDVESIRHFPSRTACLCIRFTTTTNRRISFGTYKCGSKDLHGRRRPYHRET